jgi:hypothetical protein
MEGRMDRQTDGRRKTIPISPSRYVAEDNKSMMKEKIDMKQS